METDYLVIGAGATAMAFVDALITEQPDAKVLIVDRHHRPGGHWNEAYSFVRLHTPAVWYGVASREMASGAREAHGTNAGMWHLATGPEILTYFDTLMQQRFMATGQVQWAPRSEWLGSEGGLHRIRSLTTGDEWTVRVRRKRVDATLSRTEIPATNGPGFAVEAGVTCIAPGQLPFQEDAFETYVVIGAAKTGMDSCLWLLENGVPHERIRWVMPRDPWIQCRENFQPGPSGWKRYLGATASTLDAIGLANTASDVFKAMETAGVWQRIDSSIEPSTFRRAIVSHGELDQLRRLGKLGNIMRIGRVARIDAQGLHGSHGSFAQPAVGTLYVHCTAAGLQPLPGMPVFDGDTINLQMVRACQLIFSSALIAWVESHSADDEMVRNALCQPVPTPEVPLDLIRMWSVTLGNLARWRQEPALMAWIGKCRFNGQTAILAGVDLDDEVKAALGTIAAKAPGGGSRTSVARRLDKAAVGVTASSPAKSGAETESPPPSCLGRRAPATPGYPLGLDRLR